MTTEKILGTQKRKNCFLNTDHLLLQELMLKNSKRLTSVFNIFIRGNCTEINGIVDRILLTNVYITLKDQYHELHNHQRYNTHML